MVSSYLISTRTHPRSHVKGPTAATRARIRAAARATLAHQHAVPGNSICVIYSVDSYLQQLNRQFSGVDAPTDVLAFPDDAGDGHLGDVIISAERAAQSARRGGHGTSDELQLLTVHGALHLLGHDHTAPTERARMWKAQAEILAELGLSVSAPAAA